MQACIRREAAESTSSKRKSKELAQLSIHATHKFTVLQKADRGRALNQSEFNPDGPSRRQHHTLAVRLEDGNWPVQLMKNARLAAFHITSMEC